MRIGIVNDLMLATEALKSAITLQGEHRVVWTASSGAEAVGLCANETPDLVLMDLIMPGMDGVEATRQIMSQSPCAILVVTASVGANARYVFDAMGYGALDAVDTPALGRGDQREGAAPLLKKIEIIGKLIGAGPGMRRVARNQARVVGVAAGDPLVAIGASAGGPAALATVLQGLPADLGAAIVIVQHVDERFAPGMAQWLGQQCGLPVRLAQEGERLAAGTVLLAGKDHHLQLKEADRLGYTREPSELVYRPSVDVFFQSIVRHGRSEVVGLLLTGMGEDGALGLKELRDRGHHTIAQDRATSAVYGMPRAAARLGAAVDILPVERIAARLVGVLASLARGRKSHA
jgi:two-component system response regulator WspF